MVNSAGSVYSFKTVLKLQTERGWSLDVKILFSAWYLAVMKVVSYLGSCFSKLPLSGYYIPQNTDWPLSVCSYENQWKQCFETLVFLPHQLFHLMPLINFNNKPNFTRCGRSMTEDLSAFAVRTIFSLDLLPELPSTLLTTITSDLS